MGSIEVPPVDPPYGAPSSELLEVRDTPHSGRAVFALQDIPADTLVWRSDDLVIGVLLRQYRREVCGECFAYEHGRDLKIRDAAVGFSFCSEACQLGWRERSGHVGVEAWVAVEKLVRGRSKEDAEMVDVGLPRLKPKEIRIAWEATMEQAALIRIAREGAQDTSTTTTNGAAKADGRVKATKQHHKALHRALMQTISPDIMTFCVSGILWKYNNARDWERMLALAADDTPYHNSDDLRAFTRTYLHMLAILPLPLLQHITPEILFLLSTRDSHNSFGIRSLEDGGSEFFGYGCWPAASYFNHSCAPNIDKKRVGREWHFRAATAIARGDELCISYLSGEERSMSAGNRTKILQRNWGFECACLRCREL